MILHTTRAAICAALALASCTAAQSPTVLLKPPPGHDLSALAAPDTRAVVLIFLASDCPISDRYIPTLQHLDEEFAPKHVRLWIVYPNPTETPDALRHHREATHQTLPELLDPDQSLVRLTGVHATPEAAIFTVKAGQLHQVYRGRIDDRDISFGQQRPQPTRNDLEDAVADTLAGRKVTPPRIGPVGCAIVTKR